MSSAENPPLHLSPPGLERSPTVFRIPLRALALLLLLAVAAQAETRTIARCGKGYLEEIDGYKVLHLKGTPYEMGYQQGALLKQDVNELVRFLFDVKAKEFNEEIKLEVGGLGIKPDARGVIRMITQIQKPHVPARFYEEMRGLADGSGVAFDEIVAANFIPELFHCSGFALAGKATKDGTLYHGRVLDYGCDWRLQEHAVLVVAEPEGKIPFVNVSYAGFIGSVTGMNARQVAVGEMGGAGLGKWNGTPMSFLVRMVLEEADDLDEGIALFRDTPRTCQYFYVLSDGKSGQAVGMEASHQVFSLVRMGESHDLLPEAVPDAVLLSAGDRYKLLVERTRAGHGQIDAEQALRLMDRPVAMKSNLHNVLFEPRGGKLWVANASKDGQPAATQPYHAFDFPALLRHEPATTAPEIPLPARPAADSSGAGGR
jgi:hypothetical protein